MNAQTDLTIYDQDRQPLLNIEFKAKWFSTAANTLFTLEKDLQKLLREPTSGMWFHILPAVDNSTVNKLFGAISKALVETMAKFINEIKQTELIFHLCVIKQRFSLHKHIIIDPENNTIENLKEQFYFSYRVNRSDLTEVGDSNGWYVGGSDEMPV